MQPYRVIGIESSPYAVKVRAVMRYRHLPHLWVARMPQFFSETAEVRPLLMPVVQYPDGAYRTDSTPILEDLDRIHPDARRITPDDPAQAFLSLLIEDFADEWLTKSLFHYRFSNPADAASGAAWVMDDAHVDLEHEALEPLVKAFTERQVGRMPLVGCTPDNAPLLEDGFKQLLDILESFVATDRFLFGSRPSLGDFGLYGQLHTLFHDPTPMGLMRERAPRTWHWVLRLGDASGVTGCWSDDLAGAAARGLLALIGRLYLPYLVANAAACDRGDSDFEMTLDGRHYAQPVFRYQRKCLDYLQHRYAALAGHGGLRTLLADTGCLAALSPLSHRT